MLNVFHYTLQISLDFGLILNCTLYFIGAYSKVLYKFGKAVSTMSIFERSSQKQLKYSLQKRAYSQKHSKYCLKALKSRLYMLKSYQKYEKAFVKLSVNQLLSMVTLLFMLIAINLTQSPQSKSIFFIQSYINLKPIL